MEHLQGGTLLVAVILSALLCGYAVASIRTARIVFSMGGIRSDVLADEIGPNVRINYRSSLPATAQWQVHELPVDITIDPKLRCRPEYVGKLLYNGVDGDYIYNATVSSLILNSLVVILQGGPLLCSTIVPDSLSLSIDVASIEFKSGLFGRIYFSHWAGGSYVVGRIKTEKGKEYDSTRDLGVPRVSIVIHNTTLGPYDTMQQGCDSLMGGPPLQVLVTDANYLPNLTFHQSLGETLALTPLSGHGVSVQTTDGTILGCGRLQTVFPVDASYQGNSTLSQLTPYFQTRLQDPSLLDILQYNILDGTTRTCSSKATIFDPWGPPGPQVPHFQTSDQFPVGDLPNHRPELVSFLPEVPLIGSATILGHVVNDSECSPLELAIPNEGYIVKGYAVFRGPALTGRITLTQAVYLPDWVLGPTVITVDLAYTDSNQSTSGHTWYIYDGFTNGSGICSERIGAQYNPYGVNTSADSGYFDDCTSLSQQRCAMGDLSGKLGALGLEPVATNPHKATSFYDENLHLLGPSTVLGHTIVVYGSGVQSEEIIGCANIDPSLVAVEEISFPMNGSNPGDIDRFELGRFLSMEAGVPLGDVLVNDVIAVNISGNDCLTAILWITGVDAENVSLNAGNVSVLDQQNLGQYSAGPCVFGPSPTVAAIAITSETIAAITAVCVFVVAALFVAFIVIVVSKKKKVVEYSVEGQLEQAQFSSDLVRFIPSKKDKWELLGSDFKVGAKLGEGNFGQVYKGTLTVGVATAPAKRHLRKMTQEGKPPYTVAIKILKGGAGRRELENFQEEIAMMKKVSTGECCHVVQMVGCVSTALPLALALEFIPFGDLLSYLKYWRQKSVIAGNADVTRPSGHASHGHDKPNPKEGSDHEEGMYVGQAATKVETSYPITEGHAKGLHVLATQEQDSKEFKGERGEEWLPLVTIVNQESANSDHPKVHSPTTEEQDLLSPPPRELMVKQCRAEGLSQPIVLLSTSNDEEGTQVATSDKQEGNADGKGELTTDKEQKMDYSPLGEPDLRELPSFAHQIAQGMEYLSSLGVLHRDLACRNFLVDERKLLKISDFGLSRDTPEYVSSLKDKMPLRWMAPETVTDNVCTDKSDVWAYGVCLWEMYTLGELPYQEIPMQSLVAQVVSGCRLLKPAHASEEVYHLMLSCWRSEPQARLSFTQLKYSFKSIVAEHNKVTNYITVQPNTALFSNFEGNKTSLCEEDCQVEVA